MGTALNPATHREMTSAPAIHPGRDRMASLLRVVSAILFLSLILSIVVGLAIFRSDLEGESLWPALAAAGLIVATFTVPYLILIGWVARQVRGLDRLVERARRVAVGDLSQSMLSDGSGFELDELARSLEEWRLSLIHQRDAFEDQRRAVGEILDGIGEGLVAIDRRKRVVLANARLAELLGIGETVAGKPFLEVIRSQPLIAAFDRALAGHRSSDRATMIVGGVPRQIEIRVFPIATASEIAAVALFIDVTRMEHLERVRRDFIADFSHEVRTPLAGIRSAIDTFEADGLEPEQELHLRKIISRQVTRLEKLVEELGELRQIETGEIHLNLEPVHLLRLLEDLADDFSETASNHDIRFFLPQRDAVALADLQKIQQVFANLIDNAIKHGGGGGEVRLEIAEDADMAVVRVIDRGDGIPPAEQERIFNRLYRIDRSRSQDLKGTGLGLAITRHLVQLHAGSIEVKSEPGRGATFEVRLPLAP